MKIHNLSRRRFLQGSAAVGASGLLLGCSNSLPRKTVTSGATAPTGEMHEWLFIGTDNTIIMTNPQTEMGQGVNTSLPQLLAEELDADWQTLQVRQAPLDSKFNSTMMAQMTGGSLAVQNYYHTLRAIGAGARQMILKAAAAQLGTNVSQLSTRNAQVIYQQQSYPYGQFADAAASLPVPDMEQLTYKKPSNYTLIGKPLPHRDTLDRITGKAQFGIDVQVPNLLNAAIIHAPVFGTRPIQWNEQAALAVKGVKKVIPMEHALMVVAEKYWQAKKAINLLQARFSAYDSDLPGLNSEEIEQAYEAALNDEGRAKIDAAHIIDVEYMVPFLAHATMEPMNATAWVQADRVDLWIPSQSQTIAASHTKAITGFDDQQIHIHNTLMGGGFGRRGEGDFVAEAVIASMVMQQPVKVIWSREEDIQHDMYRPAVISRFQVGLDTHFKPVAWHNQLVSSSVLRRLIPTFTPDFLDWVATPLTYMMGDMIVTDGATRSAYLADDKHPQTTALIVDTNVPVGPWRSVSFSSNCFFTESVIDEAALLAQQDPYQYRSNLMQQTPREKAVLDAVAQYANWGETPAGQFQGIAVAFAFQSYTAMVVDIGLVDHIITIHKVTCAVDCGKVINPNGARAQLEGGINFALSAAMFGEITIADGHVVQGNFHDYPQLRLAQSPVIEVFLVPSGDQPTGLGEVGVPPLAPALCNALAAAGQPRIRSLPLSNHGYQLA